MPKIINNGATTSLKIRPTLNRGRIENCELAFDKFQRTGINNLYHAMKQYKNTWLPNATPQLGHDVP